MWRCDRPGTLGEQPNPRPVRRTLDAGPNPSNVRVVRRSQMSVWGRCADMETRCRVAQYSWLAYRGLHCGECRSCEENSDVGCEGCRDEPELVDDCPARACAIRRGIRHCGECDEFPCEVLNGFYTDGVAHHALAHDNIERIRHVGAEEWVVRQGIEYTCRCGKRRLWFATECTHRGGTQDEGDSAVRLSRTTS